jgi:hypothetical protein
MNDPKVQGGFSDKEPDSKDLPESHETHQPKEKDDPTSAPESGDKDPD